MVVKASLWSEKEEKKERLSLIQDREFLHSGNIFFLISKKNNSEKSQRRTKISNFHINRTASVVRGPKTQKHRRPRERARAQKKICFASAFYRHN